MSFVDRSLRIFFISVFAFHMSIFSSFAVEVNELPSGGTITSGSADISTSSNQMMINQYTDQLIAEWQTFNIGENAGVQFIQPGASSVALNRIFDLSPSEILGSLSANGQVFLLNSAGIIFGQSAQIDVGSLVASTLNISDENFLSGNYLFSNSGAGQEILNYGTIVANGGVVALMSPRIINEGIITAHEGAVGLIAADQVVLDFFGDGLLNYTIDQGTMDAVVENKGLLKADGGLVLMTAEAASDLTTAVVNNQGIIEAHTVAEKEGRILLLSDMDNGETIVGGILDASAPESGNGGFIETSADTVTYAEDFFVTAGSSNGAGGLWLIDPSDSTINQATADGYVATLNTGTSVINAVAGGNITLNNGVSISKTGGGDATLTFKATGNIIFEANSSIGSTSGALNTVLWADSDANGGYISLGDDSSITTNGGHLWMGGGSGSTTWNSLTVGNDAAWGIGTAGIAFGTGTINTGVGDIRLSGKADARGIHLGSAVYITTTSGNVDISATSTNDIGLMLQGPHITTGSGNITLTGSSTRNADWSNGVRIESATIHSTSGDITIDGTNDNAGSYGILSTGDIGGAGSTSDILLKTNSIALAGTLQSTGTLTFENQNAGTAIAVGTAYSVGEFNLSADNFSTHFVDGFSSIVIGSATAGNITVGGSVSYNDPLTLKTAGSIIVDDSTGFTGAVAGDDGINSSLVLWSDADGAGDGYVQIGLSSPITTNGGGLWIGGGSGTASWTPYSGGDALVVGDGYATGVEDYPTGVYLGDGAIGTNGGNVAIYGQTSTSVGVAAAHPDTTNFHSGIYTVYGSNKNVSMDSGTGTILLDGKNVLQENAGGEAVYINGGTIVSSATTGDAITIIGDSSAAAYGAGTRGAGVTFIAWTNQNVSLTADGGGNIVITGTTSDVGSQYNYGIRVGSDGGTSQIVTTNGGNISLTGTTNDPSGVYSVGFESSSNTISSSGNLTVVGSGKPVYFAGAATVTGATSITADATDNITLSNASNNFTGAVSIVSGNDVSLRDTNAMLLGAATVSGTLTLQTAGAITQNGALDVTGTTSITAGSGNNITLNNSNNDFTGAVSIVSGNDVSLRDANAMLLGAATVSGNFTLQTAGALTQSGALGVTGTTTITAGSGNNITLDNNSNDFTGAVSVVSGNDVSLRDSSGLVLGASTVSGNLTLQVRDTLTQNAALSVTGTTSIAATAGSSASLNHSLNDFGGVVSVSAGVDITIVDSNALSLGAVNITGVFAASTLSGNLTLTGAIATTDTTSSAIVLNAGSSTDAGTSTGGNIIISGGSLSTGAGGRSTLYTGSIDDSTGLTNVIGSGTGHFRYNSDESASHFTTDLGSGNYAIYREQPTITVTAADEEQDYTGIAYSGGNGVSATDFENGDTASIAYSGTVSYGGTSQGAIDVGTYTIVPSGYTSLLGYALTYANGTLTIGEASVSSSNTDVNTIIESLTSFQLAVNGTQGASKPAPSTTQSGSNAQISEFFSMGPGIGSGAIDSLSRLQLIIDRTFQFVGAQLMQD